MSYDTDPVAAKAFSDRAASFPGAVQMTSDTNDAAVIEHEVIDLMSRVSAIQKAIRDNEVVGDALFVARLADGTLAGAMSVRFIGNDGFIQSCGSVRKHAGSAMLWALAEYCAANGLAICGVPTLDSRAYWDLVTQGNDNMPADGVKFFIESRGT